jgi:malate synthase A
MSEHADAPASHPSLRLRGERRPEWATILSDGALLFIAELAQRFGPRVQALLAEREVRQAGFDAGVLPDFLPETRAIREGDWTVAALPDDLQDRRVEITGPVDRKMVINALNSGASTFMADFEDSTAPTWENVVQGQQNLFDAVRRTIRFERPGNGGRPSKTYLLNEKPAVLLVRPRGLHLVEAHLEVGGQPVPASLFDFGLFFFHNAAALVAAGTGPYLYLPKLEHHTEAQLWDDVFAFSQDELGVPVGTIKATVLVETLPAAFQMHEILHALRRHSAGLNCGRWDYIFSVIKTTRAHADRVTPDRGQLGMTQPFMRAYTQLLVQTCHRRDAPAMGGMAAQIPIKRDPVANATALDQVRADKEREARDGHDGTWVAHPGLVPVAREVFDRLMPTPNQRQVLRLDVEVTAADLLAVPMGTRSLEGFAMNVRVGVQYLAAWLGGSGCVPLYDVMEDAATAEISRAQLWQWIHHGVALNSPHGPRTASPATASPALLETVVAQELAALLPELDQDHAARLQEAATLFIQMCTAPVLATFLTLSAYERIVRQTVCTTETHMSAPRPHDPVMLAPLEDRWEGIERPYAPEDVDRLRGSLHVECTLARRGARRLWQQLKGGTAVRALGALTGNQAVQQVRAGLEAIYLSGWQVAADANGAGQMYPDQSLYPVNSVPQVVERINHALQRADQVDHSEGLNERDWFVPIVADAEAGFGGKLNAHELMKSMIRAGAAGVHFEDQLASEKKCGHLGGKVLVPTKQFVQTLVAARLAADVMDVPTVLIARTDANSAGLITSDIDPRDHEFMTGERTAEGFHYVKAGIEQAISRGLAYAPYADLIWCETGKPDLDEARQFAEAIHAQFPGKMLAYNCSPSFNWRKHLDQETIARFQTELAAMGYRFQFVTLAGFHALNHSMFQLARGYRDEGMAAYSRLQQEEFAAADQGYTAVRHQREVGTGYFDSVSQVITGGNASTLAMAGSTEHEQF